MMDRILSREGVEPLLSGLFFKAVFQAVLLLGSETSVVTPYMRRALGGFQDQAARRLTGQILQRKPDRKWTYTPEATAREEAGLLAM